MSNEALRAIAQKAAEDPAFADRVKACTSPDEVIAAARAVGLELSLEDIHTLARHAPSENLSDEQLDQVSGGGAEHATGRAVLRLAATVA